MTGAAYSTSTTEGDRFVVYFDATDALADLGLEE